MRTSFRHTVAALLGSTLVFAALPAFATPSWHTAPNPSGGPNAKGIASDTSTNFWALEGTTGNNVYYYDAGNNSWNGAAGETGGQLVEDAGSTLWMTNGSGAFYYHGGSGWVAASQVEMFPPTYSWIAAGDPGTSVDNEDNPYDVWAIGSGTLYSTTGLFGTPTKHAVSWTGSGPSVVKQVAMFPAPQTCTNASGTNVIMSTPWVLDGNGDIWEWSVGSTTNPTCLNGTWNKDPGSPPSTGSTYITSGYVLEVKVGTNKPRVWAWSGSAWGLTANSGLPSSTATVVGLGATDYSGGGLAVWGAGGNIWTYY